MNSAKEQNSSEERVNLHDTSNSSITTPSTVSASDGGHDNVAFEREKPAMDSKDNEMELVQMNTANKNGDTFTQYYLPVNTHKKLLRGEKLYVTRDSRSKGISWQKIALCGVIWLLIALIFVLSALAATGVILGSSTAPSGEVELYVQSNDSLNGISNSTFLPLDTEIPYTIATYPHVGDATNSKVLLGSFSIVNLRYDDVLANRSSSEFLSLQRQLENELYLVFSQLNVRGVSVDELTRGSVVVNVTLSWPLSRSTTPAEARRHFFTHLNRTSGFLGRFLLDLTSVNFRDSPGVSVSTTEVTRPSGYGKALESDWPSTHQSETTNVWSILTWLTTTPLPETTKDDRTSDNSLPTLHLHSFNASSPTDYSVFVNPTSNYTEETIIELHTFSDDYVNDTTTHTQTDDRVINHTLWFSRMTPQDSQNATIEIIKNETTVEAFENVTAPLDTTATFVNTTETKENTTEEELFTTTVVTHDVTAGVNGTVPEELRTSTEVTEVTSSSETEVDLNASTEVDYFSISSGVGVSNDSNETSLHENGTVSNFTDFAVSDITEQSLDTTTMKMQTISIDQSGVNDTNETYSSATTIIPFNNTTILEIEYNVTELELNGTTRADLPVTTEMMIKSNVTELETNGTTEWMLPTTTENVTGLETAGTTPEIVTDNVTETETVGTDLPTTTEVIITTELVINATEVLPKSTDERDVRTNTDMTSSETTTVSALNVTEKINSTLVTDIPSTEKINTVITAEIAETTLVTEQEITTTTESDLSSIAEVTYGNTLSESNRTDENLHITVGVNDDTTAGEEISHNNLNTEQDTVSSTTSADLVNGLNITTTEIYNQEVTSTATATVHNEIVNTETVTIETTTNSSTLGGIVFGVSTTDEKKSWWLNETSTINDKKSNAVDITTASQIHLHETNDQRNKTDSSNGAGNTLDDKVESTTSQNDETTTTVKSSTTFTNHDATVIDAKTQGNIPRTTTQKTPENPHLTTTDSSENTVNAFVATVVEVTTTNNDILIQNDDSKSSPKESDGVSHFDKMTDYVDKVELTTTLSEASEVVYTNNEENSTIKGSRRRRRMNRRRPINRRQ